MKINVAYGHPWFFHALAFHILWDIFPYAIDRVLAGELALRDVPDYIRFALEFEAGTVELLVGDAVADYQVTNDGRKAVVLGELERQGAFRQ